MSMSQSVLSRLPPEVLGECFLCCIDQPPVTAAQDEAPICLTFVCCSWRAIASSTPRLWARLSIEIWNLRES